MSEIQNNHFRVILLAATILTLWATPSLSADIRTLRKQAEAGNANAQFNLGSMYETGSGVRQDYAEAAKWYRKAAERGDARAQYNLIPVAIGCINTEYQLDCNSEYRIGGAL